MRTTHHHQPGLIEPWLNLDHSKELQAISQILDKHPQINELILHDLQRAAGSREPTGAQGLSCQQVLRGMTCKSQTMQLWKRVAATLAECRTRVAVAASSGGESRMFSHRPGSHPQLPCPGHVNPD